MAKVGQKAPDFNLTDYEGNKKTLADYKGKNVVLAFYPAAFTGTCEKEMCTFQDAQSKYIELDAEVLGVSVDSRYSNKAFADKNNIKFPLMSDHTRETVKSYVVDHENFGGMPGYTAAKRSVFVLDDNGTVRYKWVADNPGQEPDYNQKA
jgi:peroxiredoxin